MCWPTAARSLTEPEAKAVLEAYDIPVVETVTAADPAGGGRGSPRGIGFPVVLKILSPDITHKSDVGGVHLDLRSPEAVEQAAREICAPRGEKAPGARISGFTVQAMVRPAAARTS